MRATLVPDARLAATALAIIPIARAEGDIARLAACVAVRTGWLLSLPVAIAFARVVVEAGDRLAHRRASG